ncbi:MAG: helix-turn-helix domain-containing protein [Bradymonadia bacterium]
MTATSAKTERLSTPFGQQLRHWRKLRGLSQLELALKAGASPRHVSFIETGRSRPGAALIMRLAEAMDIPPRGHNDLLLAAGLPPAWPEESLDEARMAPFRRVIDQMLARHAPLPAVVFDRLWTVVQANGPAQGLLGIAPGVSALDWLVSPQVKALVENWEELVWHAYMRLRREVAVSQDADLEALLGRLQAVVESLPPHVHDPVEQIEPVVCTRLRVGDQCISTLSTIAQFGGAREVTLHELRLELMFPADEASERWMMEMGAMFS